MKVVFSGDVREKNKKPRPGLCRAGAGLGGLIAALRNGWLRLILGA